jgi:hypothetical protein
MVHMAWVYLTEKQMPHNFWFYAVTHVARMMKAILGKYEDRLALPFMLIHGIGNDTRTWIPLFSLCYFHQEKDGNETHSKHMAHTMDGVIIGWSPTSNVLLVYNRCDCQYYKPDSYHIDSYHLLGSVYPTRWSIFAHCCTTIILCSRRNNTLPVQGLSISISPQIYFWPRQSWIYHSCLILLVNLLSTITWFCSIIGQLLLSLLRTWLVSFHCLLSMSMILTPPLLSCLSFSG